MGDIELYSQYFPVGRKVGVGIPMPNAEVFKDWAIIHEIDEDLVSLQLSRDFLPADVYLHYGQILELRGGGEESGYCCRAIVVSEDDNRILLLRLIGEIVSDELREFYRIDAFLPIKYFISSEQHIDKLRAQWEERRQLRLKFDSDGSDKRWAGFSPALGVRLPQERHESKGEIIGNDDNDTKEKWDSIIPLAANLSGGGIRIITHQQFEIGEYTLLEILVPSPQRVVDVVGRVVFANRNYAAGSDKEYYNTGVQFVYIDERDRDAIVNYVSTIQMARIKQLREQYLYRGAFDTEEVIASGSSRMSGLKIAALVFLSVLITALLVNYFWYYAHEHPKGEIERTFEDGVSKYRKQFKLE